LPKKEEEKSKYVEKVNRVHNPKLPLDFSEAGQTLIYENKLKMTWMSNGSKPMMGVSYVLFGFVLYNTGFFLYTFKFSYLLKAFLLFIPNQFAAEVSNNLKDHARCMIRRMYLMEDGMNVKLESIDGHKRTMLISSLSTIGQDRLRKVIRNNI